VIKLSTWEALTTNVWHSANKTTHILHPKQHFLQLRPETIKSRYKQISRAWRDCIQEILTDRGSGRLSLFRHCCHDNLHLRHTARRNRRTNENLRDTANGWADMSDQLQQTAAVETVAASLSLPFLVFLSFPVTSHARPRPPIPSVTFPLPSSTRSLSLPSILPSFPPYPSLFHFPIPSLPLPAGEAAPLHVNPARKSEERCKFPQLAVGRSPSRNRIWCILALKSDISMVAVILVISLRIN